MSKRAGGGGSNKSNKGTPPTLTPPPPPPPLKSEENKWFSTPPKGSLEILILMSLSPFSLMFLHFKEQRWSSECVQLSLPTHFLFLVFLFIRITWLISSTKALRRCSRTWEPGTTSRYCCECTLHRTRDERLTTAEVKSASCGAKTGYRGSEYPNTRPPTHLSHSSQMLDIELWCFNCIMSLIVG